MPKKIPAAGEAMPKTTRRTFIKAAVIAASTPTMTATAFAGTTDHVTLASMFELHALAYDAECAEWKKLSQIEDKVSAFAKAGNLSSDDKESLRLKLGSHTQAQRGEDAQTVVRRMEDAIFSYRISSIDEAILFSRWMHERLTDGRCLFDEFDPVVRKAFAQIARMV
ncbi:hypothetical protein [Agrobacterium leguminum]|uniref:hypothetical protein n=1 Tax=Agrobacterium leguminum TaxID=2792015 RepID=UPI003CE4F9F4